MVMTMMRGSGAGFILGAMFGAIVMKMRQLPPPHSTDGMRAAQAHHAPHADPSDQRRCRSQQSMPEWLLTSRLLSSGQAGKSPAPLDKLASSCVAADMCGIQGIPLIYTSVPKRGGGRDPRPWLVQHPLAHVYSIDRTGNTIRYVAHPATP